MTQKNRTIQLMLLIFPVFWVVWGLVINHLSGPHYLSRSDPEYVYLVNGMNAALIEFDRIGHVDHPGTPFQLLTGVFIALTYWITGTGSLVEDVISYPEKYLYLSSFFLSLITGWLIYRISRIEYRRTGSLAGAMIIPVTLLFYSVVTDLPSRYIPDRFLMIVLLWFSLLSIQYLYMNYPVKRYVLYSALLMALGIVTKINFLPFVVLPLFFISGWQGKWKYGVFLILFAVILFLPVHKGFNAFWNFTVKISSHDGLYGGGHNRILDMEVFFSNLLLILRENIAFSGILFLSLLTVAIAAFRHGTRKENSKELLILVGFLAVSALTTFLVAKHYKNYYMIPALVFSGFALCILWEVMRRNGLGKPFLYTFIPLAILLLIFTANAIIPGYKARIERRTEEQHVEKFIRDNVGPNDLFLVEPTWMSGPTLVNGLVYGVGYVVHRHYFFNDYEKVYPNVLTYEGRDRPLRYFKMVDANNGVILKSGKDIYLLSTPGRNAGVVLHYLDSCAVAEGLNLGVDTVYTNDRIGYHLLRISNTDGWRTLHEARYSFEMDGNTVLDDRGSSPLQGPFRRLPHEGVSGSYALQLDKALRRTPALRIQGVIKGDLIQLSIKRWRSEDAEDGMLTVQYMGAGGGYLKQENNVRWSSVHPRWELVLLTMKVEEQPADSTLTCSYAYQGEGMQIVDDLTVRHISRKPTKQDQH